MEPGSRPGEFNLPGPIRVAFHGERRNRGRKGMSPDRFYVVWNETHPNGPIETTGGRLLLRISLAIRFKILSDSPENRQRFRMETPAISRPFPGLTNQTSDNAERITIFLSILNLLFLTLIAVRNGPGDFDPNGKQDGAIMIKVRVNPLVFWDVNDNYRGESRNAENFGASADELIALWNQAHADDPIEPWQRRLKGPPGWIRESSWLFPRIFGEFFEKYGEFPRISSEDSGKYSEDSKIFGEDSKTCGVPRAWPAQGFEDRHLQLNSTTKEPCGSAATGFFACQLPAGLNPPGVCCIVVSG